jgi:hypothetical protein
MPVGLILRDDLDVILSLLFHLKVKAQNAVLAKHTDNVCLCQSFFNMLISEHFGGATVYAVYGLLSSFLKVSNSFD